MTARSIWLELDSVHSAVLRQYMADGTMPNLARLARAGTAGALRYEIPFQVGTWTSVHTGLSAADHGTAGFDSLVPGSYRLRRLYPAQLSFRRYWQELSGHGKRVLVMNPVYGALVGGVNGIELINWATHVNGFYLDAQSAPAAVADELRARFPEDVFQMRDWGNVRYVDGERLVRAVRANLERKSIVFCELIDREHWDHVHIGLDDLHAFSHLLWHLRSRPGEPADRRQQEADTLFRSAFTALDATIGTLLDRAGGGALQLVITLGGIDDQTSWSHMVDAILARIEHGPSEGRSLYGRMAQLWNELPHAVTSRLLEAKTSGREALLARRRRRRRAFALPPNDETGGIRINLKGREPEGRVAPGEEFDRVCDELAQAFLELKDVDTGRPIATRVERLRDALPAHDSTTLPDLAIHWAAGNYPSAVRSDRLGRVEREYSSRRPGNHQVDGMFIAAPARPAADGMQPSASVLDLAPTVAAALGMGQPARWLGTPLDAVRYPAEDKRTAPFDPVPA